MTEQEKTDFFNEHFDEINHELNKRKNKWQLRAIPSIEFLDVKQIILLHIFKKIHLYDKTRPFLNWLNSLISNQISNLLRNLFYSISRPCLKCACCLPSGGCELYEEQNSKCVLFKHWENTKKSAHSIRLPLPQENHQQEVFEIPNHSSDIQPQILEFHIKIKKHLKSFEQKIYYYLFELGLSEAECARKMGYSTKEKFRKPGYASISKAKKVILAKAKKLIGDGEIDII